MTPGTPEPVARPRRTSRAGAALAVMVALAAAVPVLAAVGGQPAAVEVSPADGAAVSSPPAQVRVTFPDRLSQIHIGVSIGEASVVTGPPTVDGTVVTVPVEAAREGAYVVRYHGALRDGSEVTGESTFTVGSAAVGGAPTGGHDHGPDPLSAVLLALDAVMVVAVVVLLLRRRDHQGSLP